jgi:predicted nucleic acid-binding protein
MPRLGYVEICGAVARILGIDAASKAAESLAKWTDAGLIHWEDLNSARTTRAREAAIRYRLRGADAVYVALAEGKSIRLKTIDKQVLDRAWHVADRP